jgi:hypothetical protein
LVVFSTRGGAGGLRAIGGGGGGGGTTIEQVEVCERSESFATRSASKNRK